MRIVTFNAEHGRRRDGHEDVDALAEGLAALAPDVVALQEVDQGGASGIDHAGAVAAAVGGRSVFAPLAHHGSTGVALVARGELADVEVLRFTSRCGHAPGWRGRLPLVDPDERAALIATVAVDGCTVHVATAHLHLVRDVSHAQLEQVVAALAGRSGPKVLAGDLNRRPWWVRATVAAGGLELVADETPTHPAERPVRRIDHVATSDLRVTRTEVVALPISDHRALVVDLALAH